MSATNATYSVIGGSSNPPSKIENISVKVELPELRDLLLDLPNRIPQPMVNIPAPVVNVEQPPAAPINIHIPEAQFTIPSPVVNVSPAIVNVSSPEIIVPPASVIIEPLDVNVTLIGTKTGYLLVGGVYFIAVLYLGELFLKVMPLLQNKL